MVPSIDSLVLEEPEIVRQGGRYGVRLKASAPSIHKKRNKQKVSRVPSTHILNTRTVLLAAGRYGYFG